MKTSIILEQKERERVEFKRAKIFLGINTHTKSFRVVKKN